ncbi:hypothetical protein AAKU58_000482 [Oxalobacteraceae bacterium GrIS 1.18]
MVMVAFQFTNNNDGTQPQLSHNRFSMLPNASPSQFFMMEFS